MTGERSQTNEQEVVPSAILVASLVFGGYVVWNQPFGGSTAYIWWIILGGSLLGLLYVIFGFRKIFQESDVHAAVAWLFNGTSQNNRVLNKSAQTNVEKVPPPTTTLKNELYFERANRRCEWCDERVDSPDIHHIKPRAEGGQNHSENLIVLCPNCHRKADRGAISRSKLKYQVKKQSGSRRYQNGSSSKRWEMDA
ncbi:HNH endonuclease [Haladaptatus sp. W1]|uniref:HNH endonuclease n=1 Tax=Haladaptatus sp. W1 TaxID=1897478 RepID=UPI0009F358DB|nr:HNH endonuclease signature motif containing protein [Haladaptatus sp. W1]